jgi:hypothetical protein
VPETPGPSISADLGRWRTRLRSLPALWILFRGSRRGPCSAGEFLQGIASTHRRGLAASHASRTRGLWRMETLGYAYGRSAAARFDDPRIPREVQPIVHVGFGIATTEAGAFSAAAIASAIESRAHPDFRLFAWEAVGCVWAVRADRWLRTIFRGTVGGTRIPTTAPASWRDFADPIPAHAQRLLAHGFGRTLYFRHPSTARALRAALEVPGLDVPAALQGISFAHTMVNHRDLDRLLAAESGLGDAELSAAYDRGQAYALAFWEWAYPSFLDGLPAAGGRPSRLRAAARELIARSREEGALSAFVGEDGARR